MKKVVLGVSGGIAAYKMPNLASKLVKAGYDVHICMTKKACEFITPFTFEAITHNKCVLEDNEDFYNTYNQHIRLGQLADIYVIAPATANTIAKLANGIADNIVTEVAIVTKAKILVAPAMNSNMYENSFTKDNINRLKAKGIGILEPDIGRLACDTIGIGRLRDIDDIFDVIEFEIKEDKDLLGKKVLVNAGATEESLDPVRFITNHSTGKMGYEVARAAANRGASVTLISAKTKLKIPYGLDNIVNVINADEMFNETIKNFDKYDIIILTAAVSDYTVRDKKEYKIKKDSDTLKVEFIKTKDILEFIGKNKLENQKVCGFCMETDNLIENAKTKLKNKKASMIVANSLNVKGAGFGTDTNVASFVKADEVIYLDKMSKYELANKIFDELK